MSKSIKITLVKLPRREDFRSLFLYLNTPIVHALYFDPKSENTSNPISPMYENLN